MGPSALNGLPVKLLYALSPRPRFAYLVDAPADVAAERSADPEDARQLAAQNELYREVAKARGLRTVDASGALAASSDVIVREVLTDFEENHRTVVNGLLLSNPEQLNRVKKREGSG